MGMTQAFTVSIKLKNDAWAEFEAAESLFEHTTHCKPEQPESVVELLACIAARLIRSAIESGEVVGAQDRNTRLQAAACFQEIMERE